MPLSKKRMRERKRADRNVKPMSNLNSNRLSNLSPKAVQPKLSPAIKAQIDTLVDSRIRAGLLDDRQERYKRALSVQIQSGELH